MMASQWAIATVAFAATLLLHRNRRVPVIFLLLLFGAVVGAVSNPQVIQDLAAAPFRVTFPRLAVLDLTWHDLFVGTVFLALPQVPLTLGNAVIAIREENNRLFPDRQVTDQGVATSMGLMNLAAGAIGGVPMCHGAGGMAGHVAFGARTGGATIILGTMLLVLSVFFSSSISTLFHLFPPSILGVILLLTGAQLALGSCKFSKDREGRFVTLLTTAFAMWNVGAAFVVGIACSFFVTRGWLRLGGSNGD